MKPSKLNLSDEREVCSITLPCAVLAFQTVCSGFRCPPPETISPAYCIEQPSAGLKLELFIQFTGTVSTPVNQSVVDNLLSQTRMTNDISIAEDWLQLHRLNIFNVDLNPLNLSSLARVRMDTLSIDECPTMTQISDGPRDRSLAVRTVMNVPEYFGNEEFSQLLNYLSPSDLETYQFAYCNLTENFIPANPNATGNPLEPFKFLEGLYIAGNRIKRIEGGQFRHNLRLETLSLGYIKTETGMEIGENAFLFNPPEASLKEEMENVELRILLQRSGLTDELIHPNLGLASLQYRPVTLELNDNALETVNASKWEEFLYSHPANKMVLSTNPLVCDKRVKWIKDARERLESQVLGTECVNDPGKTIFDSQLIP